MITQQDIDVAAVARLFHDTYERLAPEFGYETRPDTKDFDPESPNGKLMIAVCQRIVPILVERCAGMLIEPDEKRLRSLAGFSDLYDASGGGVEGTVRELKMILAAFADDILASCGGGVEP
jgi:hypothetical protein